MLMYEPKYFSLEELCRSETAEKRGIDNFPTFEVVGHLLELTEVILDPLREDWGGPIICESGFRCLELNKIVGGVETSAHPLGYAADLKPANGAIDAFIGFTIGWLKRRGIPFDQVIDERVGRARWLHIGLYDKWGRQRRQFLNIKK